MMGQINWKKNKTQQGGHELKVYNVVYIECIMSHLQKPDPDEAVGIEC